WRQTIRITWHTQENTDRNGRATIRTPANRASMGLVFSQQRPGHTFMPTPQALVPKNVAAPVAAGYHGTLQIRCELVGTSAATRRSPILSSPCTPTDEMVRLHHQFKQDLEVLHSSDSCCGRTTVRSTITVFAFISLLCGSAVFAADRPNILFIFSDDHAQHAISAYGSKVNQTPHLDRLANGGARFANSFVTNSICTPSRATLLTGQYSHLNGVPVFNRFDGQRDHVAKHLQAAGYHTGMIGKWHLGSDPTGFDRWIILPGQGAYRDPNFLVPGKRITVEGHCTDI